MNLERQAAGIQDTAERNARATIGAGTTFPANVYVDKAAQRVPRKMQQGSGAPKLCWVCGRQLQRAPGKGLGLFYFNEVMDKAAVVHRVHGEGCTRSAIEDGCKVVAPAAPITR